MEFTRIGLETWDIVWFATDSQGSIAYFTSGLYGSLPDSIIASKEDWEFIADFFIEQFEENTVGQFDSDCFDKVTMPTDNSIEKKRFAFSEYIEMSRKGLYSYDSYDTKLRYGDYYRVSYPIKPLNFENLPISIPKILEKTKLNNINFKKDKNIKKNNIIS
ncbi:conserved hypothetical protein [Hyella patelloides LEGE 07179]|uniref:Uncharacterized protein n=1 Tax=Hyella patelloides LEGE 07179 TaxID=945734 RepID=A0A563VRU1_9CYAN|nr:hypothetical protein [Hyella patelloides]VEP14097.1 conserved hypothetical protein [Hyella patelloides LEGE 07179]